MSDNPAAGDDPAAGPAPEGAPPAADGAPPAPNGAPPAQDAAPNGPPAEDAADEDVDMAHAPPAAVIINDDDFFDERYTGDLFFSIDHPGRTITQMDLERNQRPENIARIRNNPHSTIAIYPDKKTVKVLGSRAAVRAALHTSIGTLTNSHGVDVYQAAPLVGNASTSLVDRPHAYLAIEADHHFRTNVDGRWLHFPGDASTSISAAFVCLPLAHPQFTGVFQGVDLISPATILSAFARVALRNADLIAAILQAASSAGSLINGNYSVEGLVTGILRNSKIKMITHRVGARETKLGALYLLAITTNPEPSRAVQRHFAKLIVPITGLGDIVPWNRPVSCGVCYEIDHYDQDCEVARSDEYIQRNAVDNDITNSSDLAPATWAPAPTYRGGGRGRGGDRGGRGHGRGQGYHARGYY